jgi:hypothetical protein
VKADITRSTNSSFLMFPPLWVLPSRPATSAGSGEVRGLF